MRGYILTLTFLVSLSCFSQVPKPEWWPKGKKVKGEICATESNTIGQGYGQTIGENLTLIPIQILLSTVCWMFEPGCIMDGGDFGNRHNNPCDTACNGKLSVWGYNGTPPYAYLWNTGATDSVISGLCAGIYSCTVTDSLGSIDSISLEILDSSYVNTGAVTGPAAVYQGDTATYTVNDNAGSYYYWFVTGGTLVSSPFAAQVSVVWDSVGLGNIGTYETDSTNCVGDSVTLDVVVSIVTDLDEEQVVQQAMVIYPNPFTDRTDIVFENPDGKAFEMRVLDLSGKLIRLKTDIKTDRVTFSRDGISTGIYFMELRSADKVFLGKLMVE